MFPAPPVAALVDLLRPRYLTMAQPLENLDPDDTEAIIAAFLDDAASHQWGDEEVNQVLEQILQADAAHQAGETPPPLQQATPVPAPFHA